MVSITGRKFNYVAFDEAHEINNHSLITQNDILIFSTKSTQRHQTASPDLQISKYC